MTEGVYVALGQWFNWNGWSCESYAVNEPAPIGREDRWLGERRAFLRCGRKSVVPASVQRFVDFQDMKHIVNGVRPGRAFGYNARHSELSFHQLVEHQIVRVDGR